MWTVSCGQCVDSGCTWMVIHRQRVVYMEGSVCVVYMDSDTQRVVCGQCRVHGR